MSYRFMLGEIAGWLFGITVMVIGLLNTFWGNDTGFGIFLILLAFVYFPPLNAFVKNIFGFTIPIVVKVLLGLFIIWAALGVGELFNKLELMTNSI